MILKTLFMNKMFLISKLSFASTDLKVCKKNSGLFLCHLP